MKQQRNSYSMVTPETWELIRAAYLSGQSATVVAARFGTTAHAIRKRAGREGWTKLAYARAKAANGEGPEPPERDSNAESKGPVKPFGGGSSSPRPTALQGPGPGPEPREVLRTAVTTAGRMLMEGRGAEAQAMVRAAEGLVRLNELAAQEEARSAPLPTPAEILRNSVERREQEWGRVEQLARELLGDCNLPAGHMAGALRWRAEHLGREVAEADRERARRGGWYDQVFKAEGSVISPEEERARDVKRLESILSPEMRAEFRREAGELLCSRDGHMDG